MELFSISLRINNNQSSNNFNNINAAIIVEKGKTGVLTMLV